jgi:hypothetical protein
MFISRFKTIHIQPIASICTGIPSFETFMKMAVMQDTAAFTIINLEFFCSNNTVRKSLGHTTH